VAVLLLLLLQSHTQLSTSLVSILPDGEAKEIIQHFNQTKNSKILLLAVKGEDESALLKIQNYEKALLKLPLLEEKNFRDNLQLQEQIQKDIFSVYPMNQQKLKTLNVSDAFDALYEEMTSAFSPVIIDKNDPLSLLKYGTAESMEIKDGYMLLDGYGYMRTFVVKSQNLEEHAALYKQIKHIVQTEDGVKVFSPFFYYVENSHAIRSDVNKIIYLAMGILLLLYLYLLRDLRLLLNTLATLGTSAVLSTILLTQLYGEVSIFVLVFGISISTIAIDYMFHHYLHHYYAKKALLNKEVLFGYLTTMSAFFILSFTDFLLIRQISLFAMFSLTLSYIHFSFLYPSIQFREQQVKEKETFNIALFKPKTLFLFSLIILFASASWLRFDFDLAHLDYDNKTLKQSENFFLTHMHRGDSVTFAIKAENINRLIDQAKELQHNFSSVKIPFSSLPSKKICLQNKTMLEGKSGLHQNIKNNAERLGFKKDYFKTAYHFKCIQKNYTLKHIGSLGLTLFKIGDNYITYGQINKSEYAALSPYNFVESLSLKERFETSMQSSMKMLVVLGVLALMVIIFLLYIVTGKSMGYAMLFLIFPLAMSAIYAYTQAFNILHLFMLFVVLAIGIDYGIYLSKENDARTRTAIRYSLISTFAGFGVLVFSNINALYSLGVIATIGIVSIFILLVFVKGVKDES
jgi:predicted exporter